MQQVQDDLLAALTNTLAVKAARNALPVILPVISRISPRRLMTGRLGVKDDGNVTLY